MASVIPMTENTLRAPNRSVELGAAARVDSVDNIALFTKLTDQFRRDARESETWRRKSKGWYAMRAGKQWDSQTLTTMKNEQRPALTFNRAGSVIKVVSGIQVGNKQDVHVYPRAEGDAEISEIGTEGVKWFDDRAKAQSEESHAFRDTLTCGVGCTETRVDHLEDPKGKGHRDRVFPLDVFWDADARKQNLDDARRVFRLKVMELDEAISSYPDIDPRDFDADWTGLAPSNLTETINEDIRDYRQDNHSGKDNYVRPVRLVQAQWWEREYKHVLTVEADGSEHDIEASQIRQFQGIEGYSVRRVAQKVWYFAIIGKRILRTGRLDPQGQFHFKFMTGEYNEEDNYWYGLMEPMMDPQKWQNKIVSAIVHIIAAQSKGGIMYETDAFVNKQKALKDWTKPNSQIEMNRDALSGQSQNRGPKVQEKPVGQLPPGLDAILQFSERSIYQCPGVPFELLAQEVSDQLSGVQEFERVRRGINVLADYFDSLKLYRVQQAELTLDFIRSFFQGQLMRITQEGKQQYVKIALQDDVEAYDFVIDDSPSAPNQKERTWQLMLPLLPIMVQLQAPAEMWSTVLEYSPLPSDLVKKLIGSQDESGEQSEEEKLAFQLQMRQLVAQIMKTESEGEENLAQAQKALTGAHLDQAKAADLGFRQTLDGLSELHEMKVSDETPPKQKQVVDIQ